MLHVWEIIFNSNVRLNSKLYPTFRCINYSRISLKKLIQRNVGYNLLFKLTLLLNIICLIQCMGKLKTYLRFQMIEEETHEDWIQRLSRIPVDRWLRKKLNNKTTVMVIATLAGTMLLLHTTATFRSPAELSEHYNRISSAAFGHFKTVFGEGTIEPLSSVYCSPACPCACRPWRTPDDADPPEPAISNCGPTADRRGRHQNVLAYTYFGTNVTAYLSGIKENAMRALGLYPGWTMRVYHNGTDDFPAWNMTVCEAICQ